MTRTLSAALAVATLAAAPALAQFTGPTAAGAPSTVAAAQSARTDTYVTVTGAITSHLRGDYFMFSDDTGEMRIEIAPGVWNGRRVGPDDTVRILGEVDRNAAGTVYLWVKTLDVVN